jgi:hypothetical protein
MTQCRPLPYLLHVAPSKEDGGTLERGTTTYSAPAWDDAVTLGQRNASPPSPLALCNHPRRCAAIPGTAGPSCTLWELPVFHQPSPRIGVRTVIK